MSVAVPEIVRLLGPDQRVLSVTTPAQAGGAAAPLGCILVNAGVIHRIGPHRINVKLARALAGRGMASIRLDLSGRGDTQVPRGSAPLGDQVLADISAAMDELTRSQGCERFVMFGICSGAVNAMDAALRDPRLVGVCLYDGHAFTTWRSQWIRYWRNLTQRRPREVADSFVRNLQRLAPARSASPGTSGNGSNGRGLAPMAVEAFAAQLRAVTSRGAHVKVMYSGSIGGYYNYAGQFDEVFGHYRFPNLSCDYLPHLDHTLTRLGAQQELIERVGQWFSEVGEATSTTARGEAVARRRA